MTQTSQTKFDKRRNVWHSIIKREGLMIGECLPGEWYAEFIGTKYGDVVGCTILLPTMEDIEKQRLFKVRVFFDEEFEHPNVIKETGEWVLLEYLDEKSQLLYGNPSLLYHTLLADLHEPSIAARCANPDALIAYKETEIIKI